MIYFALSQANQKENVKMKTKKNRFMGTEGHIEAILHMIGQSEDVFREKPKVADIAAWMQVSKTTALKHIKKMRHDGLLIMTKHKYKANAQIWKIELSGYALEQYENDNYKQSYELYAQRVMKVILL